MAGSDRDDPAVSPGALRLHAEALLASFEAGHAGFVTSTYLVARPGDARATVAELVRAGVWHPVPDGYRVIRSEALRMASEVDRLVAEARALLGGDQ